MDDRDTDRELPLTDERIKEIAGKAAENCYGGSNVVNFDAIKSAIRQALKEAQEWRDMESAPIQQPVLFKAQNGMQWVAQVYRGLMPVCPVTKQPAVGWLPLPPFGPTVDKGEG